MGGCFSVLQFFWGWYDSYEFRGELVALLFRHFLVLLVVSDI